MIQILEVYNIILTQRHMNRYNKLFKRKSSSLSKEEENDFINLQTSRDKDKKQAKKSLSLTKGIPKTLKLQEEGIIEENFSYIEQGFEVWKAGKFFKSGKVWEAININTGVRAAIKEIEVSETSKKKQRELDILKKLRHPNVVEYYGHYKIKNKIYLVMEYIPRNLMQFYQTFGKLSIQTFLFFAKQIISVFVELHKRKIFHQDFKCENVLVTDKGILKLCDFGLSRSFDSTLSLKRDRENLEQTLFQTFWWSPPQKLKLKSDQESYDREKADIWSIGCAFVELISGNLPWSHKNFGNNRVEMINFIANSNQLPELPENCHQSMVKLTQFCLQRNPELRLSAREILNKKQLWENVPE